MAWGWVPGIATIPTTGSYFLTDTVLAGFSNTAGKTATSCALTGGENTAIIATIGQSLADNNGPTPVTPTNITKVQMLNLYDGLCYQSKDPQLGASASGGTYQSRLGDLLINAGKYARVIFVNGAIGGSTSAQWSGFGVLASRSHVLCMRMRQQGWLVPGIANLTLFGMVEQGQGDNGTSSATYQANWISALDQWNGTGCTFPWMIAVSTMAAGVVNPTIQGAQAALVNGTTRLAGPNIDTAVSAANRSDGTHPTDAGKALQASAYQTAINANF